jgi:predicted nucleic acid-binding protein
MELCLPQDELARRRTLAIYDRLEDVGIEPTDFDVAAEVYRTVRLSGHTVRSLIDCLIAAVAERCGATLAHADVDFDRIAAVRPDLRTESWL